MAAVLAALLYAAWVVLAGLSAGGLPQKLVQRTWRVGKAARNSVLQHKTVRRARDREQSTKRQETAIKSG